MISRLTLRNFKSIGEQVYEFSDFDLLVGRNNSGKSTILQSLAIWQFCVDEFHRANRGGSNGIQIVLPNFTALPVPEFNLLWKDRTDRVYDKNTKQTKLLLIEIEVEWLADGKPQCFGLKLRYQSPQAVFAIPNVGWKVFHECYEALHFPRIAFAPPFSGLEPNEKWLDVAPTRQQVGKGQPGSVLRNLLLRVCPPPKRDTNGKLAKTVLPEDWKELTEVVRRWFSIELQPPQYDSAKDVYISVEYKQNGKLFDLISGGSGFHQTMTLLAFLYGYKPTTILLDEPDAHLHVNLQREVLDYFKKKSIKPNIQFLIATHAEEFVKGVDPQQILSLLNKVPSRIQPKPSIIRALAEVSNEEIASLISSPYILYVEGESDERIILAWAEQCGAQHITDKIFFKVMGGGTKQNMKALSDGHFEALQQIVPNVKRVMLFDYDNKENAFHPSAENKTLVEWQRKNIENYLLVPEAWKRAAASALQLPEDGLFAQPAMQTIDDFFGSQNLSRPPKSKNWRSVSADIFGEVNGKRILFEAELSLFQQLQKNDPSAKMIRESVARAMTAEEIHEDVHQFFAKLISLVEPKTPDTA